MVDNISDGKGNGNTWAYRESTIVEIIEAY